MKDLVSVPQQGLLIMNCKYEIFSKIAQRSFRPQQGLLIMNNQIDSMGDEMWRLRPQQGLLIMNAIMPNLNEKASKKSFRPQQGLLIMNVRTL